MYEKARFRTLGSVPDPTLAPTRSPEDQAAWLLAAFQAGRSPLTLAAYTRDLADFQGFLDAPSPAEATRQLLTGGLGQANALVLGYRAHLEARGLAAATVQRRLSALRALVRLARMLGLVSWTIEIQAPHVERCRDTRGPGRVGFQRILTQLESQSGPAALRDRAMIRLLYDLALRRAEVVALDLADLDLERGTLAVLGKGRTSKVPLTLPKRTSEALGAWVTVRGPTPGALFTNFDRARKGPGRRLTGTSLYRVVVRLGQRAGIQARPHGLRHAAITEALDRSGGDVRSVQRFSRHRDLRTLLVYDDNRQDLAGRVARLIAGE